MEIFAFNNNYIATYALLYVIFNQYRQYDRRKIIYKL